VAENSTQSDVLALDRLVLSVFRLNGFFLRAADGLTAGSGLTTARWQVLRAVLHEPLTVAGAARSMGLTRQSCQRVADALVAEGLCEYLPNPAHRRAKLLTPTDEGLRAIQHLGPRVTAWSEHVRDAIGAKTIHSASDSMQTLLSALLDCQEELLRDARAG
jgi:DNA-binding MarR family transcriptional regulator